MYIYSIILFYYTFAACALLNTQTYISLSQSVCENVHALIIIAIIIVIIVSVVGCGIDTDVRLCELTRVLMFE